MPTVDERLEQVFAAAAVEPSVDGDVFRAVARKRQRIHTRRVARNVGTLVVLFVLLAGSLAWLTTDTGSETAVAPSRRNSARLALPDAWLGARPVALTPDVGFVRGPLLQSGEYTELSTYTRDGAGFKVPSHVVRVDASGRVLDEVELQGEILSLTEGEGARWVVTHDGTNVPNRLYRVKRIDLDGTVLSNPFPAGVEPNGPVVAGGGGAWVPIDGGVLRFDPTTGAYTETVTLPGWRLPRLLRVGSDVYVYASALRPGDGSGLGQLVRLTPAASGPPNPVRLEIVPVSMVETPTGPWALTWTGGHTVIAPVDPVIGAVDRARAVSLPKRFNATALQASGSTLWARGSFSDNQAGLARIKVRSDGRATVGEPVMFRAPNDGDILGLGGNEVLVAADGALYRVEVH